MLPVADPPGDSDRETSSGGKPKRCPICGKPAKKPTLPFCSSRCRDVDLNRWFSGAYVVPASDDDSEEGD
jgi:endogenous inhibitor of DNA gyrase (YacG/DUF329 family)